MSGCNHTVAMQGDTLFTISELPQRIKNEVYSWNSYNIEIAILKQIEPKLVKPIDFLDGRKGYMNMFCYCPSCGKKIDWKMVKEIVKSI